MPPASRRSHSFLSPYFWSSFEDTALRPQINGGVYLVNSVYRGTFHDAATETGEDDSIPAYRDQDAADEDSTLLKTNLSCLGFVSMYIHAIMACCQISILRARATATRKAVIVEDNTA
jgi:hypothetical protein